MRGYKSYDIPGVVRIDDGKGKGPFLRVYTPKLASIGMSGVSLTAGGEISAAGQTGRVDFLTFRDFRVNGVDIEIEEYDHAFSLTKNGIVVLPSPVVILIGKTTIAKATFGELIGSKKKWIVTGVVLVFGRFTKFGFGFKRVVAMPIEIEMDNPIAGYLEQ